MYYIEKEGLYKQGVFWIGNDLYEGVQELLKLAYDDRDDYHTWYLKEYEAGGQCATCAGVSKHIKWYKNPHIEVLTTANGVVNVYSGSQLFKDYLEEHYTLTKKEDTTC